VRRFVNVFDEGTA